jgi:hypothetical protein
MTPRPRPWLRRSAANARGLYHRSVNAGNADRDGSRTSCPPALPGSGPPSENSLLNEALRKPRDGEKRIQGLLTAIECNARGITFNLRAGNRLLQFHSDNFERVDITAFTKEVTGQIACGPRKPENPIVITYAAAKAGSKADGEANAMEFVPGNFVLKQ